MLKGEDTSERLPLLIKHSSHKFRREGETRLITVINNYPFYRSTGTNSGMPNTFVPFEGLDKDSAIDKKPLLIMLQGIFPDKLIKKWDSLKYKGEWERFKNLDCLLLSMMIGGGVWDTEASKNDDLIDQIRKSTFSELKNFLYENYPEEINELQSKNEFTIDVLQNMSEIPEEQYQKFNDSGIDDINKQLKEYCSPSFDDDHFSVDDPNNVESSNIHQKSSEKGHSNSGKPSLSSSDEMPKPETKKTETDLKVKLKNKLRTYKKKMQSIVKRDKQESSDELKHDGPGNKSI